MAVGRSDWGAGEQLGQIFSWVTKHYYQPLWGEQKPFSLRRSQQVIEWWELLLLLLLLEDYLKVTYLTLKLTLIQGQLFFGQGHLHFYLRQSCQVLELWELLLLLLVLWGEQFADHWFEKIIGFCYSAILST